MLFRSGLSHGHEEHCHSLPYDHLVLALGSTTNFFNLPGLADRALTMKSLDDAIFLRNRLIANLEEADFECSPSTRAPLLNFVVAGGGFAGVETIAGINDFLREAVRFREEYAIPKIRLHCFGGCRHEIRIVLGTGPENKKSNLSRCKI